MKKRYNSFLSIIILCFPIIIYSQTCPSTSFKTLLYENDSTIYPDNTIDAINIAGNSAYFIGGTQIAKIDLNGNRVWNGSQNNNFNGTNSIPYIAPDGKYYLVTGDFKLLHVDANENTLWQKYLIDTNCYCNPQAKHITQTSDGGFIITGSKTIMDTTFFRDRIYIVKTNSSGDTSWTKTIAESAFDNEGYYAQGTSDGGYLLLANIGYVDTNTIHTYKIGVIKLNSYGQEQWFKTEPRSIFFGAKIKGFKTNDGNCAFVASIDSNTIATSFVKMNETGDAIFDTVYKNRKFNGGIMQLANGDYLIGMQDSLSKIDGNTNAILWSKSFRGIAGEKIPVNCIKPTCDNGFIIGGNSGTFKSTTICCSAYYNYYHYYSYLIKTDSTCSDVIAFTGIVEHAQIAANTMSITPNPFSTQASILFEKDLTNATIKIIDLLGKEVRSIHFSGKQLNIEKAEMKAGIYFVQVIDEQNNRITKKIVIQ